MAIEERLNEELKRYMRAKDAARVACIRQLKSKVQEAVNAKGFTGPVDDALHQRVIASYVKSLEKAIEEMARAGDKSQALRDQYAAEIAYLSEYMPKLRDAASTKALVEATLARLEITDVKQAGRVVGALMKEHRGELDPALTRQLVESALSAAAS